MRAIEPPARATSDRVVPVRALEVKASERLPASEPATEAPSVTSPALPAAMSVGLVSVRPAAPVATTARLSW